MAAPKSGSTGSPVSPAKPKVAKEADDAKAGDSHNYSSEDDGKNGHKPDKTKTSWIELEMVYESNGKPVAGVSFEVTLPDNSIAGGTTDENGIARVEGIDPGSCKITFPQLDKEAWEDA